MIFSLTRSVARICRRLLFGEGLVFFKHTLDLADKKVASRQRGCHPGVWEGVGLFSGMVLAKPGSITPHTEFEAEAYILTKEEGGRHTPFFNGYRPQFYFRTTDVTGVVSLGEGVEMVMPGDNIRVKVKLITPIAMEDGLRFAIREGGRTVGAGVISKVIL